MEQPPVKIVMTSRRAWCGNPARRSHHGKRCAIRLWWLLLVGFGGVFPLPVAAQTPVVQAFTALPLPVGSGARALGQGGAFTAVADDATAAVWNPAGLAQLERPEVSIVGTQLTTIANFSDETLTEASGAVTSFAFGADEKERRVDLNFLSVTYPVAVGGRNVVFSLNYHQRYDFDQHATYSSTTIVDDPVLATHLTQDEDLRATGGIGAFSPAVAIEVSPRLSLGVTVNFLTNEFLGEEAYTQDLRFTYEQVTELFLGPVPISTINSGRFSRHTATDFSGTNVTLGAMWRAWQRGASRLTLAAVLDTPYTANVDRSVRTRITDQVVDGQPMDPVITETNEHLTIDFPLSATVAAALRLSDRTTVAVDVAWTEWSDWVQEDRHTGRQTRPLARVPATTEIDDLFTVRFGMEHVLSAPAGKVPLRAGLFYDPRPGLGNEQGIYGFSLGSGLTTRRFSLDAAYQYRTGDELPGKNLSADLKETSFDAKEHLFIASLIWYL
jgi:long-chain fatty acid transport protein